MVAVMAADAAKTNSDPTFQHYESKQAKAYAAHRPPYPDKLITDILDLHTSSGGKLNILVDVGCGPGLATRQLSPHFHSAYGLDPGTSMIETAKTIPSTTTSSQPVTYDTSSAETIDTKLIDLGIQPGTVDLITAATAAHWFQLPHFYAAAAHMLKPSGSVIIWCIGSFYIHPSVPDHAALQTVFDRMEFETLAPYMLPGNMHCRHLYRDLPLPWSCDSSTLSREQELRLGEFEEGGFVRKTYNEDGRLEGSDTEFMRTEEADVKRIVGALGTSSAVTRWRAEHKEMLERKEVRDPLEVMAEEVRAVLGRDEEGKQREVLKAGISMVVMVLKKKAE